MTLVELLVVLALLVVIGGIVVPVFTGSFSSVRLRRAGDQVLARWSHARARAIETGEVFQFTYTPETGTYHVGPWQALATETLGSTRAATTTRSNPAASSAAVTTAPARTASSGSDDPVGQHRNLPESVTFKSGEIAVDVALTAERQVTSLQSRGGEASTPILFFPDGTASQASLVIGNDRNQFVRLTLRALTGVGHATDILSQEELQRAQRRR